MRNRSVHRPAIPQAFSFPESTRRKSGVYRALLVQNRCLYCCAKLSLSISATDCLRLPCPCADGLGLREPASARTHRVVGYGSANLAIPSCAADPICNQCACICVRLAFRVSIESADASNALSGGLPANRGLVVVDWYQGRFRYSWSPTLSAPTTDRMVTHCSSSGTALWCWDRNPGRLPKVG